ncbi:MULTISPECIES: hypothetical protein [Hyphomicrobiales]|jgi:hypothetical protein|uniref:hypothetical protein n=1 Tax=Methylobacterium sp. CCH7-A2 TaxID=1768789 RepID=UPI00082FA2FD|nr:MULTISPECIES: hypothetical protein [Hyphomicrobiales]
MIPAGRPGTLKEVVRRTLTGEQKLVVALNEFLDEFYADPDAASRLSRISEEPALTEQPHIDAYIGAAGEHLARRWRIGLPPDWVDKKKRFLKEPWFPPGVDAEKPFLLAESPMAFRRRMLFVEAEPLRRLRMPHDERWYAYEQQRTGIDWRELDKTPLPSQEVVSS